MNHGKAITESQLESLYNDADVMEEIRAQFGEELLPGITSEDAFARETLGSRSPRVQQTADQEAIILAFGRPSILIRDQTFDVPDSTTWQKRLKNVRHNLEAVIPSIGRVELFGHDDFEWVGTAWVIDERMLITNRHVADVFAMRDRLGVIGFRANAAGQQIAASVDFREEHEVHIEEVVDIGRVAFMADFAASALDIALIETKQGTGLPDPIALSDSSAESGQMISVIGYPAWDGRRNGLTEMQRIFGNTFNVKRLAPGFVTSASGERLTHDASTLGGNSGSPIVDVETGAAVGLHFAGRFLSANHGVDVSVVKNVLRGARGAVHFAVTDAPDVEARTVDFYEGRQGYKEDFFGESHELYVPLPQLTASQQVDAAKISGRSRENSYVLDYMHFSSVINGKRKIPFFTAVNIDGKTLISPRRRRTRWQIDPRIDREHQAGNELYRHNRLDRGHLVRRLDPVWGKRKEAMQAEEDTFHYTNSAPQHELLNQRDWVDLEDYLLDALAEHHLKASVFTGPVFQSSDRIYRDVPIPEAFWKVVALMSEDKEIQATAYLLGQAAFLTDIEFAFGDFKTFRTSVARIEEMTELDFGELKRHDRRGTVETAIDLEVMDNPALALGI